MTRVLMVATQTTCAVQTITRIFYDCCHVYSANYDSQNGAKYGTKYPDGVNQCKVACEKVAGCDAINYNKYVVRRIRRQNSSFSINFLFIRWV